jgi:hypothetical protein
MWRHDDPVYFRDNAFSGMIVTPILTFQCLHGSRRNHSVAGVAINDKSGNIESIQNRFTAMAYLCVSVVPFTTKVQRSETFSICKRARLIEENSYSFFNNSRLLEFG